MFLDVLIIFILILFAVIGYIQGAWRQLTKIISLIIAFYASGPLTSPFYNAIYDYMPAPPTIKYYMARIIAGVCIYFACSIIGYIIESLFFRREGPLYGFNRTFGLFLGTLKTAVILVILIWALDIVPAEAKLEKFPGLMKSIRETANESIIVEKVCRFNPLEKIAFINKISQLQYLSQDPDRLAILERTPDYRRLVANPSYQELIHDPDLIRAIHQSDYEVLLSSQKFLTILQDEKLIEQARALDLESIE